MIAKEFSLGNDFPRIDYSTWRKDVEAMLKGAPFEKKLVSHTYEGIDLQPIYTEELWPTNGDPSGVPGFPPFVRGSQVLGNALTGWDIRQEHAAADPAEVNAQILDDLRNNVNSIVLRLDAAAAAGYDADDQNAADLSGRDGVIISTAADLAARPRASASRHRRGLARRRRRVPSRGSTLCHLGASGGVRTRSPPRRLQCRSAGRADVGGLAARPARRRPEADGRSRRVDCGARAAHDRRRGRHRALPPCRRDLGAGPGVPARHRRRVPAGADRGRVGRQHRGQADHLSVSIGCRFFQAIAKLRAARMLWAQVVAACGGDAAAQTMRLRATTSRRVLTTRSPASTCCGTPRPASPAPSAAPTPSPRFPSTLRSCSARSSSRRNARNTQLILAEECHLNHVIDPAGGSWYIEWHTDQLAEKAWALFQQIEAQGGMLAAASSGWVAQQIDAIELKRERDIATRKQPITGISEHPDASEKELDNGAPDRVELRMAAAQRLANWRKAHAPQPALDLLVSAARRSDVPAGELTAAAITAAGAGATLGQLAAALRPAGRRAGSRRRPCRPPLRREASRSCATPATPLPRARATSRACSWPTWARSPSSIARTTYAMNFFQAGGFEVLANEGLRRRPGGRRGLAHSGAKIAVHLLHRQAV